MSIYKNHVIKSDLLPKVFSRLTEEDFFILGYIAKVGINNQNNIGSNSQGGLTNRQVNKRIQKLINNDFLRIDKIIPWKIQGKNTKLIGLTYKGFLASLHHVPFSENIIIKTKFPDVIIPEIYSQVQDIMLDEILEFLLYHKLTGIDLSNLNSKLLAHYFYRVHLDYDLINLDKKSQTILDFIKEDKKTMEEKIETFLSDYTLDEISNLEHGIKSEKSDRMAFLVNFHQFVIKWLCNGGKRIHDEFNKWKKNEENKPKTKFRTIKKIDDDVKVVKPITTKWKEYFPFDTENVFGQGLEFIDTRSFGFN